MILDDLIKVLQKIRQDCGDGNLQVEDEGGKTINSVELKDNAFDENAPAKVVIKVPENVYR